MSNQLAPYKSSDFETLLAPIRDKALKVVDETTFIRECGFALQAVNASSYLLQCPGSSIMQAVYNVALTGLSLNPVLKLSYLIPRMGKCCLDPSYQGLVKLLTDSGSVKNVYAHLVYKDDEFMVSLGTDTNIKHLPAFKSKDIEKAYAVAILHDGSQQIEVMTAEEVNEIRDKSESYLAYAAKRIRSCIWVDNYGEMCRKTVIKRIAKYLPKTDRMEQFAQAVNIDNEDYLISPQFSGYLEEMVLTSSYAPEKQKKVLSEISGGVTIARASQLKEDLMASQVDPVTHGNISSMSQINKHLDRLQ